ncbi:MAG: hypothetical protein IPI67_32400 [Myxococcales bacterium]|nr:hypothetical protein [Myxococcales bacterium]
MHRPSFTAVLAWSCLGCGSAPKYADYVGNPGEMNDACRRAASVCPRDDDWVACQSDQDECHRLGLWFADGIKVRRDPERARSIFRSMCDRFEMGSCQDLCRKGDSQRCVDLALLGIAGAGGRVFPPHYDERDRATFYRACRAGDDVACLMLELRYVTGSQRVVQRMNNCYDDHARCFALACEEDDPLGCALLCHVGEDRACSELAALAASGTGFVKPRPAVAARLLRSRCKSASDPSACATRLPALRSGGASAEPEEPNEPYAFELTERPAGEIPRPPPPPERPVGEGLFSGWKGTGNIEGGSFGFTPVVTRSVGSAHASTHVSGLAGFFAEIYLRSWYPGHDKSLRFSLAGALGGGSAGLDGQVSHDAMAGFRLPFSQRSSNPHRQSMLYQAMSQQDRDSLDNAIFTASPHALFVRGGYSLRYSAVGPILSSAVELPRLEAGYQLEGSDDSPRALELRANAALLLVGRFNVGDDSRPLGGALGWGGALVLHARRTHAELGAQRIQSMLAGERPPVHRVQVRSCLRLVEREYGDTRYLVCLEETLEHGRVIDSEVTAWQAGLFFGFDGLD